MGAHSALLRQSTGQPMSIVYFTLVAALLYLFSDWVLQRAEIVAGRRFEHRSLIFFCILLAMALTTFTLIGQLTGSNQGV
ncbi:MAG: hypothetical protein QNJ14_03380 [Woeseiaceae bacterium]|nr:hypothetical protein [Woeseiaceae bacterium]